MSDLTLPDYTDPFQSYASLVNSDFTTYLVDAGVFDPSVLTSIPSTDPTQGVNPLILGAPGSTTYNQTGNKYQSLPLTVPGVSNPSFAVATDVKGLLIGLGILAVITLSLPEQYAIWFPVVVLLGYGASHTKTVQTILNSAANALGGFSA